MKKLTTEEFIKRAKEIHGDKYDYSQSVYLGNMKPIDIICPIHGKFTQSRAGRHLEGCGCISCGKSIGGKSKKDLTKTFKKREQQFINAAKQLNPEYNYSKVIYTGDNNNVEIICPIHGSFFQTPHNHISYNNKCPKCSNIGTSSQEIELIQYIKTIYNGTIEEHNREILKGKELDIYLKEKNIAIEYDGIYWHNNINNYFKFEECRKQGIRLIQITEWEWKNKNKLIKSYLKDIISNTSKRIFARKCNLKDITNNEYKNFVNENHLQGYAPASIKLGLFYNNELVQIMSFGKSRFDKNYGFEMIRECSKSGFTIVGGKSKLLKHFEKEYKPKYLISYCEKNKFTGNSYFMCGFFLKNESEPGYYYYKNNQKFHRVCFQKHKLKNKLELFNEELTEWENMSKNGYMRLFDYGNYVFIKEY